MSRHFFHFFCFKVHRLIDQLETGNVDLSKGYGLRKNTALHVAVRTRNFAVLKLLLDFKAPTEILNKSGESPLMWAIQDDNKQMVEYLISRGAVVSREMIDFAQEKEKENVLAVLKK